MIDSRTGSGFRATDPVWLSNFRINERKVTDYRRGRVFLAGDAAHVHSPAGGQGMNTGMQDAIALAWRLALVMRGEGAAGLLDSYSVERSAVGDMVLTERGPAHRRRDPLQPRGPGRAQPRHPRPARLPGRPAQDGDPDERGGHRLPGQPAV